jgi:hypothetical protein
MVQIKQTENGDIDLSTGRLQWIDGNEMVLQHIKSRLNLFRGTFLPYPNAGVPYFAYVFGKKDKDLAAAIIKQIIQQTPGVSAITRFDYDFNSSTRELLIYFEAKTIYSRINSDLTIYI